MRRGTISSLPSASARPSKRLMRGRALLALLAVLPGCSTVNSATESLMGGGTQAGTPGFVPGFLGGVVADEPRAALAGREVLSAGGSAADAAVAVALTLTVTLPSRAGLGGGGACIAYSPDVKSANRGVPEAVIFTPVAPATNPGAKADRPAAVPMMARGLFLLHARYGTQPFEAIVAPAEQMARFGVPISRALVKDLALVSGPLLTDPGARTIFSQDGVPLTEGQILRQTDLSATLGQIRTAGVGDMYQGALARRIELASAAIGGPIKLSDLRGALPKLAAPLVRAFKGDNIALLPPPVDGGVAAAAAFDVLADDPNNLGAATARSLAVIARYRAGGMTPDAVLSAPNLPAADAVSAPASTSFVTMDRAGNAVACALTMDNLFGTGRVMPGLGILAAASPAAVPPPLLSAGVVWNDGLKAFRAAAGASGQASAPVALAVALTNTLKTKQPMSVPVPDPGRANIIACSGYLPGSKSECGWANDPREAGLAASAN